MTRYFTALAGLAFMTVFFFENQLHIVSRLQNGTLMQDVIKSQTFYDSSHPQGTYNQEAVNSNMSALRHFANCVQTPGACAGNAQ